MSNIPDYSHGIPGYDLWKLAYPPHYDLPDDDEEEPEEEDSEDSEEE